MKILDEYKEEFGRLAREKGLLDQEVSVLVKPLTTQQAIGNPDRDDFPLQMGRERIIEAEFHGAKGHAFTDSFQSSRATLGEILEWDLRDRFLASAFVAAGNAVLRSLDLVKGTVHCRDQEPEQCAPRLAEYIKTEHPGAKKVALVGMQPAMAEALTDHYELAILDLDPKNIGETKFGARVWDGRGDLDWVVAQSDLVVATGSTLCNHTLDLVQKAAGDRPVIFFGVTVAGAAELLGLTRFCPLGH